MLSLCAAVMTALKRPPTWDEAKKALGEPSFMEKLMKYNKDTLDEAMIKKLARFTGNKEFAPESVGRVSGAAQGMCLWVHAMKVHCHLCSLTTLWSFLSQNWPRSSQN
jgi:dynein heavy chain, axonemal